MPRPDALSRRAATILAILVALVGVRMALGSAGPVGARVGLALDAASALVVTVVARSVGVRRRDTRSRRAWLLLGLAPLAWSVAPLAWLAGLPWWVADAGRTLTVLLVAGSWWFAARAGGLLSRLQLVTDAAVGATAVLVIAWGTALGEAWARAGGGPEAATAVGLPLAMLGTVVMGVGITVTEMRASHRTRPALFLVAMVTLAASDLAWSLGDAPFWAAGWVAYALSMRTQEGVAPRVTRSSTRRRQIYLAYLLVVPAVVVAFLRFRANTETMTELVGTAVIMALLVVRQHLTLVENAELVERLEDSQRRLRHQATHDELTGLPGRAALQELLAATAERQRIAATHVALAFVDVDAFKDVNDRYGHATGDAVLVEVARRLTRAGAALVRLHGGEAHAARLGGDEFAVLVVGSPAADTDRLATTLSAAGCGPVSLGEHALPVRLSVGVAGVDHEPFTPSALLHEADLAMYRVKRGRAQAGPFHAGPFHAGPFHAGPFRLSAPQAGTAGAPPTETR